MGGVYLNQPREECSMKRNQRARVLLGALVVAILAWPVRGDEAGDAVTEGKRLLDAGKIAESIPQFDAALKLNPKHANAYRLRGTAHYRAGDNDKAMLDLDKAIDLN